MHGRPDRHAGQAFPFTPAGPPVSSPANDRRGVTVTEQPRTYAATVRLRGRRGPLPVGVFWPPDLRRRRRLVVALGAGPERARALCTRTGRVVLAAGGESPLTSEDLDELLAWAGGHAAELGARPDDVLVTASGPGTAATELRRRAGAGGWLRLAVLDDLDS
jgi:hypothetical protein